MSAFSGTVAGSSFNPRLSCKMTGEEGRNSRCEDGKREETIVIREGEPHRRCLERIPIDFGEGVDEKSCETKGES